MSKENLKELIFPENFLWGTSTSSHQVEGNNFNNDWWVFENQEGNVFNGDTSKGSCNHYEYYEKDFEIAKELNTNAHRLSLEWSKIEPKDGIWDDNEVIHYRKVLQSLVDKGIKPVVTLHHFTNPVWISERGGWENEEIIERFCRYTAYVVEQYKDLVDMWITINEPNVYASQSYLVGIWPPKKKDMNLAVKVMINMFKAHAKAYKVIHDIDKNSKVSFAHHISVLTAKNPLNPLDYLLANIEEQIFYYKPLDFLITGKIKINIPGLKVNLNESDIKNTLDFLAVNYYMRWTVNSLNFNDVKSKEGVLKNDLDWEIYPKGIYKIMMKLKKYNLPIYITENGIADKTDLLRQEFIISHLKMLYKAIQHGADIRGYFHWSLIDNFEWADGYKAKFGLVSVDYDSEYKTRTIKKSGYIFSDIAKHNQINSK